MDACFDSSSLNATFRSEEKRGKLLEIAAEGRHRIIISPLVLFELLSGNNLDNVSKRADKLANLWDMAGINFAISRDVRKIIKEELEHSLSRTPILPAARRRTFRSWLTNPKSPFFNPAHRKDMIQELLDSKQVGFK